MDLIAKEVMRRSVETVGPELTLPELEAALLQARVSGFPVVDGDRLVGVVSRSDIVRQLLVERDAAEGTSDFYLDAEGFHEVPLLSQEQIAARVGERIESLRVKDIMRLQLLTVSPDQSLRAIAQTLTDNRIHRVLVCHEGRLVGLITTSDFVRLYANGKLKPA